jgi:hypothetical protein
VKKYGLTTPYIILPFEDHSSVKDELLSLLEKTDYKSPKHAESETDITKADWFRSQDMEREWVKFAAPKLSPYITKMYDELGFDLLKITEIWFQQYQQGSEHGWHTHSGNWTNVYYLEFPEGSPKTLLTDPFDRKTKVEVDVKEGDLLLFPAFVMHKAPINNSKNRKTILSYNIDADVSDTMYKQWGF